MGKEVINQSHSGYGDNVAGNKIINITGVKNVEGKLKDCIELYEKDEIDKAKAILSTLSDTISEQVLSNSIDIIKLYLNIDNISKSERYEKLKSCKSSIIFISDLIISSLLRYELDSKNLEIANHRFYESGVTNDYIESTKIWIQEIASLSQINEFIDRNKPSTLNFELNIAIINGFLSKKEFSQSKGFLHRILAFMNSDQYRELDFFINALEFFETSIVKKHFWMITYELKIELDNYIKRLIEWLNSEEKYKYNILTLSLAFLKYLGFQNKELCETCYEFIVKNEISPKVGEYPIFQAMFENNYENLEEKERILVKSRVDIKLRQEESKRILSNPILSYDDIGFVIENFTEEELNRYVSDSSFDINVEDGDIFTKSIALNYLKILSGISSKIDVSNLVNDIVLIINKETDKINPIIIYNIGKSILKSNDVNSILIYKDFLEDYLGELEHWFSPLYEIYADFLIQLQQYSTLNTFLYSLNDNISNTRIFDLKIFLLEMEGKIEEALDLSYKGVREFCLSPILWNRHIHLCLRKNKDIDSILNNFPKEIFNKFGPNEFRLAFGLAYISRIELFSEKLIDIFLEKPREYANDIAKLFFSLIQLKNIDFNVSYGKYIKIITYTKNGKSEERILINSERKSIELDSLMSKYIIFEDDLESKLIEGMEIGESKALDSFTTIKFINETTEILPFIFSLSCRVAQDLGINDSFGLFEFDVSSDNPLEMLIPHLNNSKNKNILESDNPLFIKRKLLSPDFSRDVAIINNTKIHLPSNDSYDKIYESYIVDQFSLAYLFTTGLYKAYSKLDIKFYCTNRCKTTLLSELDNFLSGNYMNISTNNGKICVLTSKNSPKVELEEVKIFKEFLLDIECKENKAIDNNINLLKIKEFLHDDTFQAIIIAAQNEIHYLNFDGSLHSILNNNDIGFEFSVSPIWLIDELRGKSNELDILNGIRLKVSNKGYFPISEKDITYILSPQNIMICNDIILSFFRDGSIIDPLTTRNKYLFCFDILWSGIQNLTNIFSEGKFLIIIFMEIFSYIVKIEKNISWEDNLIAFFKEVLKENRNLNLINSIYNLLINFSRGRFLDITYLKKQISILLQEYDLIIKE